MRVLKRLLITLGIFFLVLQILLFSVFLFVKHLRIKEIVERQIEHDLGINVTIDKIEFSPLLVHIGVSGITIHNPEGFSEGELAYINSIHFVIDPLETIIRRKPNIYLFTLNLERLNIIKNKEGKVNIKEIVPVTEGKPSKETETHFYFAVLVLSIGEVKYIDYTGPYKVEHKYPIKLKNAAFAGLKDEKEVIKVIVYKAIENTDIGKLINLTIVPVVTQLRDTMDSAWGAAKTGAKSAWGIVTLPFKLLSGSD